MIKQSTLLLILANLLWHGCTPPSSVEYDAGNLNDRANFPRIGETPLPKLSGIVPIKNATPIQERLGTYKQTDQPIDLDLAKSYLEIFSNRIDESFVGVF